MVGGTSAPSSITPHREIIWPSPAKTIASGGSGGTYTVTRRPASYSKVSVTNSPAIVIPLSSASFFSFVCPDRRTQSTHKRGGIATGCSHTPGVQPSPHAFVLHGRCYHRASPSVAVGDLRPEWSALAADTLVSRLQM